MLALAEAMVAAQVCPLLGAQATAEQTSLYDISALVVTHTTCRPHDSGPFLIHRRRTYRLLRMH